jgi:hypothetical protein
MLGQEAASPRLATALARAGLGALLLAAGLACAWLAGGCGEDEPHITFIGDVDATPPRLGRDAPEAGESE